MQYFFGILSFLTSLFLILLILIQRGRGGGLAGALGGMGGQSAFGTKAGDLFTRITIGVAAFWILLSVASIAVLNESHSVFGDGGSSVFSPGDGALQDAKTDANAKSTDSSKAAIPAADSKAGAGLPGSEPIPPAAASAADKAKSAEAAPAAVAAPAPASSPGTPATNPEKEAPQK